MPSYLKVDWDGDGWVISTLLWKKWGGNIEPRQFCILMVPGKVPE